MARYTFKMERVSKKTEIVKELFIEFLLENDCYSQFVTNLLELRNVSLEEYLNWNYYSGELMNWAFTWSRTKEKHQFWMNLNYKWKEILNKSS